MGNTLGWGLFSRKYIPKETVLGIFTGELRYQKRSSPIQSEHVFLKDHGQDVFQVIDASSSGNITRFLQHLPSAEIIKKIKIDSSVIDKVAIDNVGKKLHQLPSGVFTEIYYTKKNIEPNEIVGCCYDPQFWQDQKPLLLNKQGAIIGRHLYQYLTPDVNSITRRYYRENNNNINRLLFFSKKPRGIGIFCAIIILSILAYRFGLFDCRLTVFFEECNEKEKIKFNLS